MIAAEDKPNSSWLVRSRAWLSMLLMVPFAAAALVSVPTIQEDTIADFVIDSFGWIVFVLGATFRWWATLYIGGRKHHELVTDGPYSICRNPLYFGTVLLCLSIALFLHSVVFAVGVSAAAVFYLTITVPYEELQLSQHFGQEFSDYCARVPQFLPNIWLFQTEEIVPVLSTGLFAEMLRALWWSWIPILSEAVAHLRFEPYWPRLLPLP